MDRDRRSVLIANLAVVLLVQRYVARRVGGEERPSAAY